MGKPDTGFGFVSRAGGADDFGGADTADSPAQNGDDSGLLAEAMQLFDLANRARAQAWRGEFELGSRIGAIGAGALRAHGRQEGPIAHRYAGEPDLPTRAGQAGAHFSLIEENVAVGPDPGGDSRRMDALGGHRANLLNADVGSDRGGSGGSRGVLYAAEDFSRAVPVLSRSQVEIARVEAGACERLTMFRPSARRAPHASRMRECRASGGQEPGFVMRWQTADLTRCRPR